MKTTSILPIQKPKPRNEVESAALALDDVLAQHKDGLGEETAELAAMINRLRIRLQQRKEMA